MVALLVLHIWLADLLARCQGFRSVLGSIGELLCMCCRVLAFVLLGEEKRLFLYKSASLLKVDSFKVLYK